MKIKQRASDFRVEELTDVSAVSVGEFALYRLEKTGWTTPDALAIVRKRWDIDARRLSSGGLKDRHAETSQYFTIYRGPTRNLAHERINVTYLGRATEPFTSQNIIANRFAVTLRDLNAAAETAALAAADSIASVGLPNYFDDQRFGSVGEDHAFIAREMVFGRFEEALKLALTAPYEFDRAEQKREKDILRRHWGRWAECAAQLPYGHVRGLILHLSTNPGDFRNAVARLHPELQGLYLSVYQSALWNRILDRWLRDTFPTADLGAIELRLGTFAAPLQVPENLLPPWTSYTLPLPSARIKPEPGAWWATVAEAVLAEDGLTLGELKIPGLRKPFFSKGDRLICVRPTGVRTEPDNDDLHQGRRKITFLFDLPRASYATMFVKRLFATNT
ncbi:tRNA pseudouridine(13) synthase TruD [Fimbriiglobus ruber]|uniref:tRNA pseudouridine 13 synthase n=1 Tax=Fimbriiglobus ruber TaxID=1908690 RepID=A0A225E1A5_9BACT|nr:tRNA pseudouridine(13) synthase TruD [Fimbriiglobus ruber]OWK47500.1 tRNA pseudouridine 13 synthase [Fimbriiglobus ruber]